MRLKEIDMVVTLTTKELFRLSRARGATLEALEGTLWVTESGREQDACLVPGGRYCVRGDGLVLVGIEAADGGASARLAVRPPAGMAPRRLLQNFGFRRTPGLTI